MLRGPEADERLTRAPILHRSIGALVAFRPSPSAAGRAVATVALALLLAFGATASGFAAEEAAPVPEPEGYKTDDYRTPVPPTLKGARVIDVPAAETMLADRRTVFIDVYPRAPKPPNLPAGTVWRDVPHMSLPGAHWLPNVGYGALSPEFESYFRSRLAGLTENDLARPIVLFCQKNCWMSWNAAKRAMTWGYKDVIWFSEGTDAWLEQGHDLVKVEPVP